MGIINVLSRTQTIVVDPITDSVSIIYAGAMGPSGEPGPPGPDGPVDTSLRDDLRLVCARDPELIIIGTITRDSEGLVPSAECVWPDGEPGVFTVEEYSVAFPGAVDSYSVSYEPAVGTQYLFTQPVMTRDGSGAVIERPDIEVTVI